jgi:hypothetical protein
VSGDHSGHGHAGTIGCLTRRTALRASVTTRKATVVLQAQPKFGGNLYEFERDGCWAAWLAIYSLCDNGLLPGASLRQQLIGGRGLFLGGLYGQSFSQSLITRVVNRVRAGSSSCQWLRVGRATPCNKPESDHLSLRRLVQQRRRSWAKHRGKRIWIRTMTRPCSTRTSARQTCVIGR